MPLLGYGFMSAFRMYDYFRDQISEMGRNLISDIKQRHSFFLNIALLSTFSPPYNLGTLYFHDAMSEFHL